MHDFDFIGEDDLFDSEDSYDLDMEDVYHVPMDMIIHMRDRNEPIFAQHVFFFEKKDPVTSVDELMSFTTTWWSAITEDKNLNYIYLTDSAHNKKAILLQEVVAISFVTPDEPEWMHDGQNDSDPS